jgi:hypothetical protein
MGIMPHRDVDKALELALSLDIPFWPQLPNVSFYEDMYAQASQYFPGVSLDIEQERVLFDTSRFMEELEDYSDRIVELNSLALSQEYSTVYNRFLQQNLNGFTAIRGQLTGPVSWGFKVIDEEGKPVIYNESVRTILFDFMQRKVNTQYHQLKEKNANAFVWLDEPGLGWVFSGFTGYDETQARADYEGFIRGLDGPPGLHLCANVNLPYLLSLGVEILSFDAFQIEVMPKAYGEAVADFLRRGNIISWGIVPTDSSTLSGQTVEKLLALLEGYWQKVSQGAELSLETIARQSLIAPARCCLKNIGLSGATDDCHLGEVRSTAGSVEEALVEMAFSYVRKMSQRLKERYL